VGARLNGIELGPAAVPRRVQARELWRALLQGDFALGKRLHDQDQGDALLRDSPSDAVLLACLLVIGGYGPAGASLVARLGRKRGGVAISSREAALIDALPGAMDVRDEESLAALVRLATDRVTPAVLKHVAIASLFHAYRARRDFARARKSANALWGEAEAARQQLHAMGERTLGHEPARPAAVRPVDAELAARRPKGVTAR
jgi:hypothetical protein